MIVMHSIEQTDTCAMKLQLLFMVVKHANKTQVKDIYNNTLEEKFTKNISDLMHLLVIQNFSNVGFFLINQEP